ncbi:MAG: hypothetical protein ACYTG2_08720 [Planctomycetota bacterium]
MSTGSDLPSLPTDDQPGGRRLSSDEQLATALLLQARALERSLADRGQAGSGKVLRSQELVSLLRRAERARAEQAEASARRERRLLRITYAALLAAVLGGGSAVWIAVEGRNDVGRERAGLAAQDRAAESRRLEEVVGAAVGQAVEERLASHEELERSLTEAERRALDARAEQRTTQQALEALKAEHVELAGSLATRAASEAALEAELAAARDSRLEQIGENARLVEKVLESDRQISELQAALAGLRGAAADGLARPAAPLVTGRTPGGALGLAARVGEALRTSGVAHVQVVEAVGPQEGSLTGVMLILSDDLGAQRVVEAARAELAADERGLHLLCSDLGGVADQTLSIALPDPDLAAWDALGLLLPPGYEERTAVVAALGVVVQPHGWSVSGLQDWDGETLWGLELRRPEPGGGESVVRATRATLSPVGPELFLAEGSITTRGDERPFYEGVYRIALPGSDYGRWLATVGP